MGLVIRRLLQDDVLDPFDCGDESLNDYLKRHAWLTQEKISIGATYVAVEEAHSAAVLGYFTLATASVPRESFPPKYIRGLPRYPLLLILLARLAVDHRFASRGLGHALISEAFRIVLRVADDVGCRGLIADAYPHRVAWYARYGFQPLSEATEGSTQRMFLDIRTLRAAASSL